MLRYIFFLSIVLFNSCQSSPSLENQDGVPQPVKADNPTLIILGNVQDGGSPHIGCQKTCCSELFRNPDIERKVVALGIVDPANNKKFLMEATPDIGSQLDLLNKLTPTLQQITPDAIFLTHAHIGHYTGLMYLGKEAMNAKQVPVYAMPGMYSFLANNGPWSQLVSNKNIALQLMADQKEVILTSNLKIIPFLVPHRDEYSETVGYKIIGPRKSAIFIPDIDKWNKWETNITKEIEKVDFAFIDATFFDAAEINNRDISEIPHPFVKESMRLFAEMAQKEKQKIWFIHMNHTNPLLDAKSEASREVISNGFRIARLGDRFLL